MNHKDELRGRLEEVIEHLQEDMDDGYDEYDWVKEQWQGGLDYVYNHLKPAVEKRFKYRWEVHVVSWREDKPTDEDWRIILEER